MCKIFNTDYLKTCTLCGLEKPLSEYRVRVKVKNGKEYPYANPTCRICDSILAKEYRLTVKDTVEFKEKVKFRTKAYVEANRDKVLKRLKEKRETEKGKRYRKEYDKANKERIKQLSKIRNAKYNKKHIDKVTDTYAIAQIQSKVKGLTRDAIRENSELIEQKKTEIVLRRLKKKIKKLSNEK
jgi:hypothetical protein